MGSCLPLSCQVFCVSIYPLSNIALVSFTTKAILLKQTSPNVIFYWFMSFLTIEQIVKIK